MLKKSFDLMLVILTMPIWLSIIFIFSIFSLIFNGKPIFFIQNRGGYKNKKIKVIKFRTISVKNNEINKYSNFLRFSKIDEIPQLINILKGDISFVGPRPLIYEYKKLYKKKHLKKFEVMPGITGWSQVKSKPSMSWSRKFELDIWYVKNNNFLLDLKILILTIKKIIFSIFNKNERINDFKRFNGSN